MPILQKARHIVEKLTGIGRPRRSRLLAPSRGGLPALLRPRKPHPFRFADDGATPNHPRWPLIVYRSPVRLPDKLDPAAVFEDLFASHGWGDSWRNGIYDFLHFHTHTHEVLGIARGSARVQFGGAQGRTIALKAGDVVVLPAGTGHRRLSASKDLLVVGAYPASAGTAGTASAYDQPKPGEVDATLARASIAKVARPQEDPVYGKDGPLLQQWPAIAQTAQAKRARLKRIRSARARSSQAAASKARSNQTRSPRA